METEIPVETPTNGNSPDLVQPLRTDQIVASPLSDRLILAHMDAGNIIINPFHDRNLQNSSYDVRLGRYYYEEQDPGPDAAFYNPYSEEDVAEVWGEWKEAERARTLMKRWKIPQPRWKNIDPDDEIILLKPGRTYLCHTDEFIGFRGVGTTMMKARSTIGRSFIEVCKCAGWGDNGFTNRWTMEITNNSRFRTIPIVVGEPIAQIIFFYTGETDRPYAEAGSYQNTSDMGQLINRWSPESMLPRLKRKFRL